MVRCGYAVLTSGANRVADGALVVRTVRMQIEN